MFKMKMLRSPKRPQSFTCPCGVSGCQQLELVHSEITAHYSELRGVVRAHTSDEHLGDDLIQLFCMNLVARPHNYTPGSSFLSLARCAMGRYYVNTFRQKRFIYQANTKKDSHIERVILQGGARNDCFERDCSLEVEQQEIITQMLDLLSNQRERDTLVMLYHGCNGAEIAKHLGLNLNTTHGLIRRVRGKLLEAFPREVA